MATCCLARSAEAASLAFKVNNKTGQQVNAITVTPKSGGAAQSILASPIAAGVMFAIPAFTPAADTCVFTLSYTLASGKVAALADVDLCQTEQFILQ
ncbi:MAG: hypothetical protein KGO53_12585 [Alphaproteobacteria bacterium]|nr:hypothetical protein [Alphaproteobacteria bacterium]